MSDATELLIWGIAFHLIADWLLQNEWMSVNKAKRRTVSTRYLWTFSGSWLDRHPAAYVHAGIHGAIQLLVFPWWGALLIGVTHLIIDTRKPVIWWSKLIRQTQPDPTTVPPLVDIGTTVRFWSDQVWHIAVIAIAALAVTA